MPAFVSMAMTLPLNTQLKLLDSLEALEARGWGEDLVTQVHQLAEREGRTLSNEQAHAVLQHAELDRGESAADEAMWARPTDTEAWKRLQ